MKNRFLDCTDLSTAINSTANILNISKNLLINEIADLDLDEMYDQFPQHESFEYTIISWFRLKHEISTDFDYTYYFHATRLFKNQSFDKGIIPLRFSIDYIWISLYDLIKNTIPLKEWLIFRQKITSNNYPNLYTNLYSMKITDDFHHGPFGFLIREVIFKPRKLGNWDYLGTPEIVYDICTTFQKYYNVNLINKYLKNSEPYIVKFKSIITSKSLLGISLTYIYCKLKNIEIWRDCSFAFDGKGKAVRPNEIIEIEKVTDWVSLN